MRNTSMSEKIETLKVYPFANAINHQDNPANEMTCLPAKPLGS